MTRKLLVLVLLSLVLEITALDSRPLTSISFSDAADDEEDSSSSVPRSGSLKQAPWWCRNRDCPEFDEEDRTTYKDRRYKPSAWVSTDINGTGHCISTATLIGYWRLARYMHGKNDQGVTMMMTTPVLTRVTSGNSSLDEEGRCCMRNYTVSFFLPFQYQENPPKPSSEHIYLDCKDKIEMAVLEYSGYPSAQRVADKLDALERVLTEAGVPFCNRTYWSAVYDPPHRLHQRHNEVWLAISSEMLPQQQQQQQKPQKPQPTSIPSSSTTATATAVPQPQPSVPIPAPTVFTPYIPSSFHHRRFVPNAPAPSFSSVSPPVLEKLQPPAYVIPAHSQVKSVPIEIPHDQPVSSSTAATGEQQVKPQQDVAQSQPVIPSVPPQMPQQQQQQQEKKLAPAEEIGSQSHLYHSSQMRPSILLGKPAIVPSV